MTGTSAGLSLLLADTVARLRRAMRRSARVHQSSLALSVAQLELLSVIEEQPGSRPGELARILCLAPNSVSTLANALTVAGMVKRGAGSADRRAVRYSLTSRGAEQVSDWRATNGAALAAAVAALTLQEQQALTVALPAFNRLVSLLDEHTDQAIHADHAIHADIDIEAPP